MGEPRHSRILILEDNAARCAWFRRKFRQSRCDVTCDVRQALEWLREEEYDLILLDHDLAEEHYSSHASDDEGTGYAVASWLAGHAECQPGARIVVHSLNYVGAGRMVEVLEEAGREAEHIPFYFLDAELNT